MEWLEEILSDEKVEDKLKAIKKELPKWLIPKDKYNEQADKLKEKEEELQATVKQLEEVNKQVAELDKLKDDKVALQTSLDVMKVDMETFKADADNRVSNIKKRQAVERGLRDANANPDTIDLLVDKFKLEEIELTADDKVKDWDKHVAPIKEARKSLFGTEGLSGDKPPTSDNTEPKTYLAKYEAAIKEKNTVEAIKIRQEAFSKGEKF